jgi:hypothetical protein
MLRLLALLAVLATTFIPATIAHAASPAAHLFDVGIAGGFTGAAMTASVYADGTVVVVRQGAGSPPRETVSVPLDRSAVKAAIGLARTRHVFALPRSAQDAIIGADIPVRSLTVYTGRGVQTVHAMGSSSGHARGTKAFFTSWSLFYALAGYPPQITHT